MVSIKTGSNILMKKDKGILQLLHGGRREEVEKGLKGHWRMDPELWQERTPVQAGDSLPTG